MKRKRSDQTKLIEHVFIDGYPPKNPKPQLSFLQPPQASVGRQLSSDFQGMLNMLIDQAYPPNACPSCFEVFTARSEAKEHFKEQHRGEKTYQCLAHNCEQSYSSKPGLRYHLLNGHQATLVSDKERQQQIISKSKRAINSSIESDNENKKTKSNLPPALEKKMSEIYAQTICPACKQTFAKKTHVVKHLVEVHHGEEPYECIVPDCKHTKKYATREGLVYHLINYHS